MIYILFYFLLNVFIPYVLQVKVIKKYVVRQHEFLVVFLVVKVFVSHCYKGPYRRKIISEKKEKLSAPSDLPNILQNSIDSNSFSGSSKPAGLEYWISHFRIRNVSRSLQYVTKSLQNLSLVCYHSHGIRFSLQNWSQYSLKIQ